MKRTTIGLIGGCVVCGILVLALVPPGGQRRHPTVTGPTKPQTLPLPRAKMGYALLPLLNNSLVQDELKLTATQRQQIAEFAEAYAIKMSAALGAVGQVSARDEAEGKTALAALQANQQTLLREYGQSATDLLTDSQQHRLDQILFRLRGIEIYEFPEFAATLTLTDRQKLKIRQIRIDLETLARELAEAMAAGKLARAEFDHSIDEALASADTKVRPQLNAQQCAIVDAWAGKPIPFSRQSLQLEIRRKSNQLQE